MNGSMNITIFNFFVYQNYIYNCNNKIRLRSGKQEINRRGDEKRNLKKQNAINNFSPFFFNTRAQRSQLLIAQTRKFNC